MDRWLTRAGIIVLGFVFLVSATSKALNPAPTLAALEYVFSDSEVDTQLSFFSLIAGEIALGAALLTNLAPRLSLETASVVLAAFTGWILYLMAVDASIGCGCGFESSWLSADRAKYAALVRNVSLLGMVAWTYTRVMRPRNERRSSQHPIEGG